jgi:hypothetical protein
MSRRPAVFQDGNIGRPIGDFIGASSNAINQRREEAAMDSADRKAHLEAQRRAAAKKRVDDIANLDHIGNSTVDIATDNAMQEVKNRAYQMADAGFSDSQIQSYLSQSLPPIANGHTVAKNYSDQMRKQAVETAKLYGGDPEKLYQTSMQKAVPDWLESDENGTLSYKKMIDPNKDYISEMTSFKNLPSWVGQSDALISHVSKLPKEETTSNVIKRDKGFAHIDKQTEETNSLFEETYDTKGQESYYGCTWGHATSAIQNIYRRPESIRPICKRNGAGYSTGK